MVRLYENSLDNGIVSSVKPSFVCTDSIVVYTVRRFVTLFPLLLNRLEGARREKEENGVYQVYRANRSEIRKCDPR